ncbi:MAG: hypothetical protein ENTB_04562 [Enterocloster aldenensis]
MTVKFMGNTPYANTEIEMQRIPGFAPRKSGMAVSRFEYSATGCDCNICACKARKKECTRQEGCACLRERLVAGCVPFGELLGVLTAEVAQRPFVSRVSRLWAKQQTFFTDDRHRQRFKGRWRERIQLPDGNAWSAALYLLAADTFLWGKAEAAVKPDMIDFTVIHVHGVDLDGYVLYHTAKDLYKGTRHISLSELTDPELVSDEAFRLIVTAFLIRRYGPAVIWKEMEEQTCLKSI